MLKLEGLSKTYKTGDAALSDVTVGADRYHDALITIILVL